MTRGVKMALADCPAHDAFERSVEVILFEVVEEGLRVTHLAEQHCEKVHHLHSDLASGVSMA